MATLGRGYTFGATEQVTNTKLHNLVDAGSVSSIVNADIDAAAGIVDTKLAQIVTASKVANSALVGLTTSNLVSGSSLYSLSAIASGAGVIPTVNLPTLSPAVKGQFKNLSSAYASATTWTVTADEVIVNDINNVQQILRTVSKTINFATTGVNALDTGSVAANTIYYIYVIAKSDGTIGTVASTSATLAANAANMPTGYTYTSGAISCAGTNNSSNLISATQIGIKYCFTTWATMASGNVGLSPTVAIDMTPANMTTNAGFVAPSLSNYCFGALSGGSGTAYSAYISSNSGVSADLANAANKYVTTSQYDATLFPWQFDILTADTLYWGSNGASGVVYLHGFELNKL